MNKTNIAWANMTWNPITGCTNCYAKAVHERFYSTPFSEIVLHKDRLDEPLKRKKPTKIFIGSMTDLFQEGVTNEMLDAIFRTIIKAKQHTFMILTKRPKQMRGYLKDRYNLDGDFNGEVADALIDGVIPNLWVGVTAENQHAVDERINFLKDTPASVRFVSVEPMVGGVAFGESISNLDWVIVGGESGALSRAREMQPYWVEDVFAECRTSGTPFFFKQWGAHVPDTAGAYQFETVQEFPANRT